MVFGTSLTAKNYNLTIEITIDNNIAKDSHEKRMIFFPKPKRIWLYWRGSVEYSDFRVFKELIWEKTRQPDFG